MLKSGRQHGGQADVKSYRRRKGGIELAMDANNHIMIGGKTIDLDADGFLAKPDDWSPQVAKYFSAADGMLLTDEHWKVIRFARDYYRTFNISPMTKVIVTRLNRQSGSERYSTKELYSLFPEKPVGRICKYAGIPQPAGCT
jgi:tRNA 2-thiouridine synthesizing protein E